MEIWKVVGYREVDFTDNNGTKVAGYKLYLDRSTQNKLYLKDTIHRLNQKDNP